MVRLQLYKQACFCLSALLRVFGACSFVDFALYFLWLLTAFLVLGAEVIVHAGRRSMNYERRDHFLRVDRSIRDLPSET